MKKKMHRKMITALVLTLALLLLASAGLAEDFSVQEQNARAAAQVSLPDAAIDYAVRERDDGRYEWELFFSQGDQLGSCEVIEATNEVRRVELFARPEGGLTASEAMALLAQKKGAELTILELELDWDDGWLVYEGEAELGGRRYEFEMTATGDIIEWERD